MAVERSDVALALGIAGFVLGGLGLYWAFRVESRFDQRVTETDVMLDFDRDQIEVLVEEKTALQDDLREANKRISSLQKQVSDAGNDLAALRERVKALDGGGLDVTPKKPDDGGK